MPVLSSLVSGFKECHLFLCTTIRSAKICVSNIALTTYVCLLAVALPEIKILLRHLYACCLYVSVSRISPFDNMKSLILSAIIFWKIKKLSFGGQNLKNIKKHP